MTKTPKEVNLCIRKLIFHGLIISEYDVDTTIFFNNLYELKINLVNSENIYIYIEKGRYIFDKKNKRYFYTERINETELLKIWQKSKNEFLRTHNSKVIKSIFSYEKMDFFKEIQLHISNQQDLFYLNGLNCNIQKLNKQMKAYTKKNNILNSYSYNYYLEKEDLLSLVYCFSLKFQIKPHRQSTLPFKEIRLKISFQEDSTFTIKSIFQNRLIQKDQNNNKPFNQLEVSGSFKDDFDSYLNQIISETYNNYTLVTPKIISINTKIKESKFNIGIMQINNNILDISSRINSYNITNLLKEKDFTKLYLLIDKYKKEINTIEKEISNIKDHLQHIDLELADIIFKEMNHNYKNLNIIFENFKESYYTLRKHFINQSLIYSEL